jgi:ribosomal protein S18 acetylase RimI-like enzyme
MPTTPDARDDVRADLPAIALRPVEPGDADFLRALFVADRRALFAAAALPEPMLAILLDQQYRAHEAGTAQEYPEAERRTIMIDGNAVGRLVTARDRHAEAPTLRIVDIVLDPAARGRGIGTAVLEHTIRTAREAGWSALSLMVAHTNPHAARLYRRLGFLPIGDDMVGTTMRLTSTT